LNPIMSENCRGLRGNVVANEQSRWRASVSAALALIKVRGCGMPETLIGRKDIIQRAYELADSGKFINNSQIYMALKNEGFTDVFRALTGRLLNAELRRRSRLARGLADAEPRPAPMARRPRLRSRYDSL
jgi:hypothetical protein